jgi:chemotaxis signal transduction protein
MSERDSTQQTVAVLRRAFDGSFVEASVPEPVRENFLAVRIGGDGYALRLSEIVGLYRDRRAMPVVSAALGLLGLAAFRGVLTPVYDLGALLGYPGNTLARWLVLANAPSPIGLAFEAFEAHLKIERERFSFQEAEGRERAHTKGAVQSADGLRPVIHIASVLEAILMRVRSGEPSKER